jgi:hypothetical protein
MQVKVNEVEIVFDSRENPQMEKHIDLLRNRLLDGEKIGPITVTPVDKLPKDFKLRVSKGKRYVAIDGRHTLQAYRLAQSLKECPIDTSEVSANVIVYKSFADMQVAAHVLDSSIALPLTPADEMFNIRKLKALGLIRSEIIRKYVSAGWPEKRIRSLVIRTDNQDKNNEKKQVVAVFKRRGKSSFIIREQAEKHPGLRLSTIEKLADEKGYSFARWKLDIGMAKKRLVESVKDFNRQLSDEVTLTVKERKEGRQVVTSIGCDIELSLEGTFHQ